MYMLFNLIIIILILMIVPLFILSINYFISMNMNLSREKSSPFECGFDPMSPSNMPFSIHFYLICLMFLIFDIEIILILPMIMLLKFFLFVYSSILFVLFIFILIFGLWIEWYLGFIDWIK